jgi:uncharacterized protein (UPF0264 family)
MTRARRRAPGLLVSVRSPEEAAAALAGGAHIIDVKEPEHGSLGRADDQTIATILDMVDGRRPVSAALGELAEELPPCRDARLAFVKWGLAACGPASQKRWQATLSLELARRDKPQTVVVAYADWQCAQAPDVTQVVAFACLKPGNVLLLDTHCKEPGTLGKNRPTLLDWLTCYEVAALCAQCHAADVRIALAGSLTRMEIQQLRGAQPDWFAVRGAVCAAGDRRGAVDDERVRQLVNDLTDV